MSAFTIRVYGIIKHEEQILLSRENIGGRLFVKFPGGGLEFGEGTRDCLIRELIEELGMRAEIGAHFYTTDYFQPSAFHKLPTQVLSVYYRVSLSEPERVETIAPKTFIPGFYWKKLGDLRESDVDLPIDRKVVRMLTS